MQQYRNHNITLSINILKVNSIFNPMYLHVKLR